MEEDNAKKLKEMEEKMEAEKKKHQDEMNERIRELEEQQQAGKIGSEELALQIEKDQAEQERLEAEKVRRLLAEGIRQKQLQAEYTRVEK